MTFLRVRSLAHWALCFIPILLDTFSVNITSIMFTLMIHIFTLLSTRLFLEILHVYFSNSLDVFMISNNGWLRTNSNLTQTRQNFSSLLRLTTRAVSIIFLSNLMTLSFYHATVHTLDVTRLWLQHDNDATCRQSLPVCELVGSQYLQEVCRCWHLR